MLKYSICFSHETTFQTHSRYFDYGHYGFSISKPFTKRKKLKKNNNNNNKSSRHLVKKNYAIDSCGGFG